MLLRHPGLFFFFLLTLSLNGFSQSYNAYVRAGDKATRMGDYYSASSYYFEAIKMDNEDVSVLYKLAEASRLFNDYMNAAKFYQQTVVKDKKSEFPLAVFWLARMRQYLGDYETAKTLFSTYISRNINAADYYANKAKAGMANCDTARKMISDSLHAEIKNIGAPVNTVYSDFAAQQVSDSVLYYSSLKFEIRSKKKKGGKKYVSRVLRARSDRQNWKEPIVISNSINDEVMHNCNASVSPDGKLMLFTRCEYAGANLKCDLYESKWDGTQWGAAVKLSPQINAPDFTSTHPSVTANGAEGYTVYYSSDRPGGIGKLDIWKVNRNAAGVYSQPENLGSVINTPDDDVSPFYDTRLQSLYFSSEGHINLGGFDIFRSAFNGSSFADPVNVGYPLNTSYNEIYFSSLADSTGLFSSNRPGSMFIKARTCCYDIYSVKLLPAYKTPVVKAEQDSVTIITRIDSVYERNVFLKLYFDNDTPDRRTLKTTTLTSYEDLYLDYINERSVYLDGFSQSLTGNEYSLAQAEVNNFFKDNLERGFNGLEKFSDYVLKLLDEGNNVELKVRGSASPLANSLYNTNLSKRRIASIINYWKNFRNGAFKKHFKSGNFIITQDPVGEDLTQKGLSDNLKDLRNSVYNPNVARERYIEVIKFIVNGKEEK